MPRCSIFRRSLVTLSFFLSWNINPVLKEKVLLPRLPMRAPSRFALSCETCKKEIAANLRTAAQARVIPHRPKRAGGLAQSSKRALHHFT